MTLPQWRAGHMVEMMNSLALMKRLAELGLEQYSSTLVPLLKPGIGIVTHPADETTIPVGASKFGGSPDLPRHEKWPELYGHSLDFIAQINLADVRAYDINHQLTSSGTLFFFHNESRLMAIENVWAKSRGTILYYEGDISALERRQAPQHEYYAACTLSFIQDVNLPEYMDLVSSGIIKGMPDQHRDAYTGLAENISVVSYKASKANRMFGYPNHVQGSPFSEAEGIANNETHFKELSLINREWVLLLQVDSDSNANMFWGDYGTLYFCILKEDLQQNRFNKVIVVSQST
jgi:uncharacterized protein YwqG